MKYALDSNIVSYILKQDKKLLSKFAETERLGHQIWIPSIVYYEVGRGLAAVNATTKKADFVKLCARVGVAELDLSAFDSAIRIYANLRASGMLIEDSDILIAATCIRHGMTLITHNVKHFSRVLGLSYENWI
jgi:predicted nucleic acid-binding protein